METILRETSRVRDRIYARLERELEYREEGWTIRRLRHCLEDGLKEVEILEGQYENLLRSGMTILDILGLSGKSVLWLTPEEFVTTLSEDVIALIFRRNNNDVVSIMPVSFKGPEGRIMSVDVCSLAEGKPTRLLRFLARQPITEVGTFSPSRRVRATVIEADAVQIVLESNPEKIEFLRMSFAQDACQRLGVFRGHLGLRGCELADKGRFVCQQIGRDQGPTGLEVQDVTDDIFDAESLSTAVARSTVLKTLVIELSYVEVGNDDEDGNDEEDGVRRFRRLVQDVVAIQKEQGLVELCLINFCCMAEEEWHRLFQSLGSHRTLRKLQLDDSTPFGANEDVEEDTFAKKRARLTRSVADMMKVNKILSELKILVETDGVFSDDIDWDTFREEVKPRLRSNGASRRLKAWLKGNEPSLGLFQQLMSLHEIRASPRLMSMVVAHFQEKLSDHMNRQLPQIILDIKRKRKRLVTRLDAEIEVAQKLLRTSKK